MSTKRKAARKCTLISSAHNLKNIAGLSTCSTTFIEETTSNRFHSCTSISADV